MKGISANIPSINYFRRYLQPCFQPFTSIVPRTA
ncbi:hypothetical protein Celaphus_00010190 [Cervus elaphus hippelaphus]|uniref:Uncharacterized protein n=1 Tax=Cervus elaphus hippelaphus TaxID=46360 RepID=A0A212C9J9_CEREH|nr:hypothetical protein Celaphus_00010190 [Cervus elaphus hippelaphus]